MPTQQGLPTDADPSNPTAGKKYVQKSVSITFPVGTFTKPGVYRFVINETNNALPGVTYDSNLTRYLDVFVVADNNVLSVDSYVLRDAETDIGINISARRSPVIRVIKTKGSISHLISQALTRVHIPSSQMM